MAEHLSRKPINIIPKQLQKKAGVSQPRSRLKLTAVLSWGLVGTALFVAVLAPFLAPFDPWNSVAAPFTAPGNPFLLGTDDLGRDVLSGIIFATRTSIFVGLSATFIATAIGIVLVHASVF